MLTSSRRPRFWGSHMREAKRSTADMQPLSELYHTAEGGRHTAKSNPGHLQLLYSTFSSPSWTSSRSLHPLSNKLHTQHLNNQDHATDLQSKAAPSRTVRQGKEKPNLLFINISPMFKCTISHCPMPGRRLQLSPSPGTAATTLPKTLQTSILPLSKWLRPRALPPFPFPVLPPSALKHISTKSALERVQGFHSSPSPSPQPGSAVRPWHHQSHHWEQLWPH